MVRTQAVSQFSCLWWLRPGCEILLAITAFLRLTAGWPRQNDSSGMPLPLPSNELLAYYGLARGGGSGGDSNGIVLAVLARVPGLEDRWELVAVGRKCTGAIHRCAYFLREGA